MAMSLEEMIFNRPLALEHAAVPRAPCPVPAASAFHMDGCRHAPTNHSQVPNHSKQGPRGRPAASHPSRSQHGLQVITAMHILLQV
jgi:hypothetical protein